MGGFSDSRRNPELAEIDLDAVEKSGDDLDWQNGWQIFEDVVINSPGFLQPDIIQSPEDDEYFCYYEYRDAKYRWNIALTTSSNLTGPYETHHFPILTPTGENGCPAETGIADPTVLYLEDADVPWHMWFDMRDSEDVWRIGHATSEDGISWDIQRDKDGRPATLIDVGAPGEWDDGFVHAPEAFVYEDRVRLIYNAQGTGHQDYDGGLAVATDPEGHGFEFEKVGQTTHGDTAVGGNDIRVKQPVEIDGVHYAIHSRDIKEHATICRSNDGCETWEIVSRFPYPYANSFHTENGHLVCIGADKNLYIKRFA